jgi:hypothetical protein
MVNYLRHGKELYRIPPLIDAIEYTCLECKYKGYVSVAQIMDQSLRVLKHDVTYEKCPECSDGKVKIITDMIREKSGGLLLIIDASCNYCNFGTYEEVNVIMTTNGGTRL